MSIQICFRPPAYLHTLQEASLGLRANRDNRDWWHRLATGMSIAEANASIEAFVAKCFNEDYSYGVDLRTLGADWVKVKGGIGETLARQGDEPGLIEFCHITGGGNASQWTWRIGSEPMEYWMTADKLREELLEIVHRRRVDYFKEFVWQPRPDDNWFRGSNDPDVAEVYRRAEVIKTEAMHLAHTERWQECHAVVRGFLWPLRDYQIEADMVWHAAEYVLRQWLREAVL